MRGSGSIGPLNRGLNQAYASAPQISSIRHRAESTDARESQLVAAQSLAAQSQQRQEHTHRERWTQLKPTTTAFEVATGDASSHDDPKKARENRAKSRTVGSAHRHLRDQGRLCSPPKERLLGATAGGHAHGAGLTNVALPVPYFTPWMRYVPKTNSNSCSRSEPKNPIQKSCPLTHSRQILPDVRECAFVCVACLRSETSASESDAGG